MGTRIEYGPRIIVPQQRIAVERVPWQGGEGYLVTSGPPAAPGRRFFRSWAATLDYIVQAMQPAQEQWPHEPPFHEVR